MLDFIETPDGSNVVFVSLCFVLRIAMAMGCTASSVSSFTVMVHSFPHQAATVFGLLETAAGLGLMLGPALGGFLYDVSDSTDYSYECGLLGVY